MDQQAMYEELRSLGAATVYEAQGAKGALDCGIKPIDPASRLVGPALTVDTRPADNLMLHYALSKARPGDVLVVDAKGFLEAGPWGDVLTVAAMKIGVAGLVINGAVRDANTIVEIGFPVFCRGLSIKGTGKVQPGKVNVPVCIGDVVIRPGDSILGDRDGLVVVSTDEMASVLESAGSGSQGE
jgi:4-hydroxy-4-methyl-2-oxoglutarate aldolase